MAGSRTLPRSAVAVGEELDEDLILGRLATYTLPDDPRSGTKLLRSWAKHGLDVDDLPEARQPVHVFQSACASVRERDRRNGGGRRTQINADEVENTTARCSYVIGVKVWDLANRSIEYDRGMRVCFDKHTSEITVEPLDGWDDKLRSVEGSIREDFEANAKTVPGQKIRNAVRAQVLKIGGQNLRRKAGGLYFVPKEYTDGDRAKPTLPVLEGLAGVLADLYGEDADFYMIRMAGDEGERAMVRKHFVINANSQASELAAKAINRVRAGKGQRAVREELVTNLWNERRKLMGAVEQYRELVGLEMQDIEGNLRDLDDALAQLQEFADGTRADK